MELKITRAAHQALTAELGLKPGMGVKLMPRPDNTAPVDHQPHQAYALDNHPDRPVISVNVAGINYHINFPDSWFFENRVTTVDYDPQQGIVFDFSLIKDLGGASTNYEMFLM